MTLKNRGIFGVFNTSADVLVVFKATSSAAKGEKDRPRTEPQYIDKRLDRAPRHHITVSDGVALVPVARPLVVEEQARERCEC